MRKDEAKDWRGAGAVPGERAGSVAKVRKQKKGKRCKEAKNVAKFLSKALVGKSKQPEVKEEVDFGTLREAAVDLQVSRMRSYRAWRIEG